MLRVPNRRIAPVEPAYWSWLRVALGVIAVAQHGPDTGRCPAAYWGGPRIAQRSDRVLAGLPLLLDGVVGRLGDDLAVLDQVGVGAVGHPGLGAS